MGGKERAEEDQVAHHIEPETENLVGDGIPVGFTGRGVDGYIGHDNLSII